MTVEEIKHFQKDYGRMCRFYDDCDGCGCTIVAGCDSIKNLDVIYPIVQKWAKEHPIKTFSMDFEEKFPNVNPDYKRKICINDIYFDGSKCKMPYCENMCENCWSGEME